MKTLLSWLRFQTLCRAGFHDFRLDIGPLYHPTLGFAVQRYGCVDCEEAQWVWP